jgi:hypothetical protein
VTQVATGGGVDHIALYRLMHEHGLRDIVFVVARRFGMSTTPVIEEQKS